MFISQVMGTTKKDGSKRTVKSKSTPLIDNDLEKYQDDHIVRKKVEKARLVLQKLNLL